ncbi:carbonic anhydrase [Hesseltinella vesiculosa]|uniref:Carbonic anhydrase n=1 Tax=Hesseltinella vesiculosa TaxID=101127 RepID=A0A1X2GX37_9FUNG|nr:carbonic anhydrase [Hesseltinella vesiculosa]
MAQRSFSLSWPVLADDSNNKKPGKKDRRFLRFFQPLAFNDPSNEKIRDNCCTPLTSQVQRNKFDPADSSLDGLLENNRQWAAAVTEEDPEFFKNISVRQEPKILWIGCSDSRVPANQIVQLGPGEIFVHRNIANVVHHGDMNCLSVIQFAVESLKVEHIIVCGHMRCGGISAALSNKTYGFIDSWLRMIKDVYQANEKEFEGIDDKEARVKKLVELNAINSARNVCHTVFVQRAWERGQKLTVHAWAYDIGDGIAHRLDWQVSNNKDLNHIFRVKI